MSQKHFVSLLKSLKMTYPSNKKIKNHQLFLQNIKNKMFKKRHLYISSPWFCGSYTVEAAVLLPLFLIFAMLVLFCLRGVYTQWKVSVSMDETVNEIALLNSEEYSEELLYGAFLVNVKKNKVPLDFVAGGLAGFYLLDSQVDSREICLQVKYLLNYPISILGRQGFYITQSRNARIWNGFDPLQNKTDESYVYVAEYGTVYHMSRYCAYIDPTIRSVKKNEISRARNLSGSKYKKCPYCKGDSDYYYITVWGDCYHRDITCSALKRTIYRMTRKEAEEKYSGCSKCAK